MTNANARMATEWFSTRTPYGKGVIGCLTRSQGYHREAAAPEDRTAIGHPQGKIEEGETGAGTTSVMTMTVDGDVSEANYNMSGLARIMIMRHRLDACRLPGWTFGDLQKVINLELLQKRFRFRYL